MKLTGAYGGTNLNINREESLKKLSKFDKESQAKFKEKAEFTGVNKLEAMSAQALEQTKYYQTKISQLQHSREYLDNIENFISSKEISDTAQFKQELEKLLKDIHFSENELFSTLNFEALTNDKDISHNKKLELINEALLKIKELKKEFNKKEVSFKDEITKIKLAHENIKAAGSSFEDFDSLLNNVKDGLENNGLNFQKNASQSRIINILKN